MGTLSKFWNTNARPEGWMGRLALRIMNLTHTPMALWNLSLIDFQPDWTVLDVGCGGSKNIARLVGAEGDDGLARNQYFCHILI